MHEFSVSKNTKNNNNDRRTEMAVGMVAVHLCLTLIIKIIEN
jgi:hypothetical protein